jgi:hypothetical protein
MNYNSKIINKEIVLIIDIVWVCAVAGIGGLKNGAKRNVKPDQLRPVPRHNINKETESNEDTEPGNCANLLLAVRAVLYFLHQVSHQLCPTCQCGTR